MLERKGKGKKLEIGLKLKNQECTDGTKNFINNIENGKEKNKIYQ